MFALSKKVWLRLIGVMILGGWAKLALEGSVTRTYKELQLGGAPITIELRSRLSQNMAIGLLSGFRGIVADFVWLKAHIAWEDQVWYKLKEGVELAVVLQPHSISFWDIGSWHMAWNASHAESVNPKYPSDAFRKKMQRDWIEAGRNFLSEGIRNNPDLYDLYFKMGFMIYYKLEDPLAAVPFCKKAATFPEAPLFVRRMVGHMYEKGGEPREAYEWWKQLWKEHEDQPLLHPDDLWYKIEEWGRDLENQLNVPVQERVFPSKVKSPKSDSLR